MEIGAKKAKAKPFLRWAGGKSWLLKYSEMIFLDKNFNNYHEPFLGGAAMYLALPTFQTAYLSDINSELIDTYKTLKRRPYEVIRLLETYSNTEDFYYEMRNAIYVDEVQKAARFIYLNQTSYNGLYRVNLQGRYNVPYGFRKKNFLDEKALIQASIKLQTAELFCYDFVYIKENLHANDLIFLDPPYTVSHNNNGFIKYNQKLFSLGDQRRLSELIDYIKSIGAYYVLTNAAHQTIIDIFEKGDRRICLNRSNLLGGKKAKRGKTEEYIFTNIRE